MKKLLIRAAAVVLATVAIMAVMAACTPKDKLSGKYLYSEDTATYYTFKTNGTFIKHTKGFPEDLKGTYVVDGDTVTLTFDYAMYNTSFTASSNRKSISNDTETFSKK